MKFPYLLDEIKNTVYELILYEDEKLGHGFSIKEREILSRLNLQFEIMNINK
jgi:hypothetical protein